MNNSFESHIAASLTERRERHLLRQRRVMQGPQSTQVQIDNKNYLSFCSNDYLGLANHPDIIKAIKVATDQYGVGSGAAHLISGHSTAHHALEEELADFVQFPKVLLFSTGFMANLGVITALLNKSDAIFEDRLNHASLLDAGLHSGARFQRYLHVDCESLQQHLAKTDANKKLIVTDAVFSMDGDIAPLPLLTKTAIENNAWLMIDDAHGIGVLGEQGRGSPSHFNMQPSDIPIYMATFGKAFGTFGAFVAGSDELIEYLIHFARSYIYTTALPPAMAEATRASLKIMKTENWRREKLNDLVSKFKRGAGELGLTLLPSDTPIQPLIIGNSEKATATSEALYKKGILVSAIRPPTVPDDSARLRITLSANHTDNDIAQLLDALGECR